jgi:peptidyl-prolyl cis-trans isomerase B (cyclophilin B)
MKISKRLVCLATTGVALVLPLACSAETPEGAKDGTPMEASADPIAAIDAFIEAENVDKTSPNWKTKLQKPPKQSFPKDKSYYWFLETSEGDIKVKLLPEVAPMHVTSTIYLTRLGFYDDISFHRVISGFMAQGGCPLGRGTAGPGYKYAGEFDPAVKHDGPGKLSMANAGPNTDGSQFFLTFVPTPHLDGKHTIFGEVVEGMDVVKKLEANGSRSGRPTKPMTIQHASISVE